MKPPENIRFEIWAPREKHYIEPLLPGIKFPKRLSYGASLKRLKRKGFDRHPLPSELLKLVADGLEGKVGFFNKLALKDMLYPDSSMTQWVDMVFEKAGDELIVHHGNIDGIVLYDQYAYASPNYRKNGFRRDNEARIEITKYVSKSPHSERDIHVRQKELPDSLIELLYGKNFSGLPDTWQQDILERFYINIPREEGIYPLSLQVSTECLPMLDCPAHAASRGVRVK